MKRIPGFPNYSVTKDGRVWSIQRKNGKWLKLREAKFGYLRASLWTGTKVITRMVHRLVLEIFVGPCPEGMECRHLNSNPSDNRLENLKWGTKSENAQDAIQCGTFSRLRYKGELNWQAKLTGVQVELIFNTYHDGSYTQRELAEYFGVAQQTISRICTRKTWKHLWV